MAEQYFEASFGEVPLHIGSIDTDRGRDIAVQSPSYGDRHTLTDRGLRQQRTTCEVLFIDRPGWRSYLERYDQLIRMFEAGEVAIFSHPIDGSYRARCSEVSVRAEADSLSLSASCTFLREDPPRVVRELGAGIDTSAGPEALSVAAMFADERLAVHGLTSAAPTDALAAVTAWSEAGDDLDAQRVYLEVATLTDRIDTAIADLELAQDLSRYQAYEAMIRLRYSLTRAAEVFTADSRSLFELYVETPRPVIRICADVYGAAEAADRADEVTHLNRIRTPNLVPRGTTLKMPAVL